MSEKDYPYYFDDWGELGFMPMSTVADIAQWMYFACLLLCVICLFRIRTFFSNHIVRNVIVVVLAIVYLLMVPRLGNSLWVRNMEIYSGLNNFRKPTVSHVDEGGWTNYYAELRIIHLKRPLHMKLLRVTPILPPDAFLAKVQVNGVNYSIFFTDPLTTITWSPFRNYHIVYIRLA